MISPHKREQVEKIRSAFEASHTTTTTQLLVGSSTIARYSAPPEATVFPLEYAFHLLGDVKGKTILEYGCGDGLNTVILANRGARVIALDISAELLGIARHRLKENGCDGVELLLGSAHSLPLKDESVDVVFGMAILHHLELKLASSEIQRVLKRGGRGIFKEPVRNSKVLTRVRQLFPRRADVSEYERPLTDAEIKDFAKPCSFHAKTFQLPLSTLTDFLPFGEDHAFSFSAHLDAHLLRLCPPLIHYGTVKVFQIIKLS